MYFRNVSELTEYQFSSVSDAKVSHAMEINAHLCLQS
jgi:hypothetical protein